MVGSPIEPQVFNLLQIITQTTSQIPFACSGCHIKINRPPPLGEYCAIHDWSVRGNFMWENMSHVHFLLVTHGSSFSTKIIASSLPPSGCKKRNKRPETRPSMSLVPMNCVSHDTARKTKQKTPTHALPLPHTYTTKGRNIDCVCTSSVFFCFFRQITHVLQSVDSNGRTNKLFCCCFDMRTTVIFNCCYWPWILMKRKKSIALCLSYQQLSSCRVETGPNHTRNQPKDPLIELGVLWLVDFFWQSILWKHKQTARPNILVL